MADEYWSVLNRISPEAPVPIVDVNTVSIILELQQMLQLMLIHLANLLVELLATIYKEKQ